MFWLFYWSGPPSCVACICSVTTKSHITPVWKLSSFSYLPGKKNNCDCTAVIWCASTQHTTQLKTSHNWVWQSFWPLNCWSVTLTPAAAFQLDGLCWLLRPHELVDILGCQWTSRLLYLHPTGKLSSMSWHGSKRLQVYSPRLPCLTDARPYQRGSRKSSGNV